MVTSFRCRFASPVSTSRSSNRTGGFPASGSPTGFAMQHTKRHDTASSLPSLDPSAGSESFSGGHRQHGHSPDSPPLPDRSRSQAPSLHRHYPASSVLRACPSPHTARPVPRGRPVSGQCHHRWGFPCCLSIPLAHMPSPVPRRDQSSFIAHDSTGGGLPHRSSRSAPALRVSRFAQRSLTLWPACLLTP
jgi:hypothetical protein